MEKKWESSAFGEIRQEWRCAQYIFRGDYRDVWQWSVNKTTVIRFSHLLGQKMPLLVSHTVSIFLYFTRVFNDKWVPGGIVWLSLKHFIVPICLVDYLHHSALKHLWQFRLTDFLNPLRLLTHSFQPPILSRLSPSSIFVLCLCTRVTGCAQSSHRKDTDVLCNDHPRFLRSAADSQSLFFILGSTLSSSPSG